MINNALLCIYNALFSYHVELQRKYDKLIENRWFWIVLALVVVIGLLGYAFYCISRGYRFNGNVKVHWPKIWQIGIGCKG